MKDTSVMRVVVVLTFVFLSMPILGWGQANISGNGNWDDPTKWTSGNIGDAVTEDVTMANNRDITIQGGFNYTIGNFTTGNSAVLTILSTGTLNVGDALNSKNLDVPNGLNLTVNGVMHIHGNLIVNNNITISVTGVFIIDGDVTLNNGASLTVTSGNISVGGSFTGGNNTSISLTVPGTMDVAGDFTVGTGSTLGGTGVLSVGGSCSGPICGDSQLPVTLVSFSGHVDNEVVRLHWVTSSELNFDYFSLEKSYNGVDFFEIGKVTGHGTSFERHEYGYWDKELPVGTSYYRLTSNDFDGFRETFEVIAINYVSNGGGVNIFPNPVTSGSFEVIFNFIPESEARISIVDTRGVNHQTLFTSEKKSTVPLNVASGVYFVVIDTAGHREVKKLVVAN